MNRMSVDIAVLDKQIQAILSKQPDAQIYLVGHSLGGVIAYGYMDALQVGGVVTPLDNSNLRGVVTLDSPLGGVSTDPTYTSYAVTYFETTCPDYSVNQDLALLDLGTIYNNAPGENVPRGGHDSILSVPFAGTVTLPDPLPSNQTLARQAHNNDGTNVLTVGNTLDRLWIPDTCDVPVLQFRHTQWLVDGGDDSGIYGRAITSSVGTCQLDLLLNRGNHFDTLTNPSVLEGIQQFITGQTPSALSSAPGES